MVWLGLRYVWYVFDGWHVCAGRGREVCMMCEGMKCFVCDTGMYVYVSAMYCVCKHMYIWCVG